MVSEIEPKDFSYAEESSQMVRTKDEDTTRFTTVRPKITVLKPGFTSEYNNCPTVVQISNDDEKSAIFQEMLFQDVARRVLERNKKLFKELSRY